jgi:hypothetical protein
MVMRRGGPKGDVVAVVEGSSAALGAFSAGFEAVGAPGASWSFSAQDLRIFRNATKVIVIGDSGEIGMAAAERWARGLRRVVADVRLIDLDRDDNFDVGDLVREVGPVEAKRYIDSLISKTTSLPATKSGPRRSARAKAGKLLRDALADGPVATKDIEAKASSHGIRKRSLERARADVVTHVHRVDDNPGYHWEIALGMTCPVCQDKTTNPPPFSPPVYVDLPGGLGGHARTPMNTGDFQGISCPPSSPALHAFPSHARTREASAIAEALQRCDEIDQRTLDLLGPDGLKRLDEHHERQNQFRRQNAYIERKRLDRASKSSNEKEQP